MLCVTFLGFLVIFCCCVEAKDNEEVWSPILEELALTTGRDKRVLNLPGANNAFVVIDRNDDVVEEDAKKESKIAPGKVVNMQNNNKNKQPGREVSETDLYLLGAIEKLAYKVDFMEKRLRKVEEIAYYIMAGNRIDQEPCPNNFTRFGLTCYFFHSNPGRDFDWKAANNYCSRFGAFLTELDTPQEYEDVINHLQTSKHFRGKDFWTGGLNPGLLWIWSNSARPVAAPGLTNNKKGNNIPGDGRCLRLAYDGGSKSYGFKGSDCGSRYGFVCEMPENSSSNEVDRIGRTRKVFLDEL